MLTFEDIKKDALNRGIEADQVVRVITTEPAGESALTICFKTADANTESESVT